MRFRNSLVLLGLAALSSSAYCSTIFTALGWSLASLDVNGTPVVYLVGQDQLPGGVGVSIIDGNATFISLSSSQLIYGNQAGTATTSLDGHVYFQYKVMTSTPPQPNDTLYVTGTAVHYASAMAWTHYEGFSANSTGTSGSSTTMSKSQTGFNQIAAEDSTTNSDRKQQFKVAQSSWQFLGGTRYSTTVTLVTSQLSSLAKVSGNASGGTFNGAEATGVGSYKFYPTGIKYGPGELTFVTNARSDELLINVYTDSDMHLDDWAINLESDGKASMMFTDYKSGSYVLRIRTRGTLWTPVSFTYAEDNATLNVNFIFGDLDADNAISAEEVAFVQSCIGKKKTDGISWFVPNNSGWAPKDCDFNGDDQVTQADYDLCKDNVGMHGH